MYITIKTNHDKLKSITIDKDTVTDAFAYEDHAVIHRRDLPPINIDLAAYEELASYLNGARYERTIMAGKRDEYTEA